MKRYVVNESEGVKGKLPVHGGGGTFSILIDEEISGAQHFSLLANEMAAGYKGKEKGGARSCNHASDISCFTTWRVQCSCGES